MERESKIGNVHRIEAKIAMSKNIENVMAENKDYHKIGDQAYLNTQTHNNLHQISGVAGPNPAYNSSFYQTEPINTNSHGRMTRSDIMVQNAPHHGSHIEGPQHHGSHVGGPPPYGSHVGGPMSNSHVGHGGSMMKTNDFLYNLPNQA